MRARASQPRNLVVCRREPHRGKTVVCLPRPTCSRATWPWPMWISTVFWRSAAARPRGTRPQFVARGVNHVQFSYRGGSEQRAGEREDAASNEQPLAPVKLMRSALDIDRVFDRTPFVPADRGDLAERCETIFGLQAAGLKTRLAHTGIHAVPSSGSPVDSIPRSRCSSPCAPSMPWVSTAPASWPRPCRASARPGARRKHAI